MRSKKTALLTKFSAFFLLGTGVVLISLLLIFIYQRLVPAQLAFASLPDQTTQAASELFPKLIIIPDLHILLPIQKTTVTDGKWEAYKEGVSYLGTSPIPGSMGNSILFGHNWPNRLGALRTIKIGQTITIVLSDGTPKTFEVVRTDIVTPDQTHILNTTEDTRITLYTCTGLFDLKRFVVTALLRT